MNKFLHQYSINQYLLIILLLGTFNVLAAPFITTWQPTFSGPGTYTVTIPTVPGTIYNYSIDWDNDGIIDEFNVTGDATHSYALPGPRTIRIDGLFPRIYINDGPEKDKILSVEQWGTIAWSSMEHAFNGASNLVINAPDTPNLTNVTNLVRMFKNASNLGNGTGNWNWAINNVQYMTSMFLGASNFNKDISNWDTSNVISMEAMFADAVSFDQDLSAWNVENVDSFLNMFAGATLSRANYDALLISWDAQTVNPALPFTAGNSQYCSQAAQDARANLIATDGWTITDAGLAPACDGSLTTTHFVITVDTTIAGSTGPNSFNIPTTGSGYNYNIDSNNSGIFNITGQTGDTQLNYGTPGIKTIRIAGDFPRIYFNNSGDKDKILSVEQWGTIAWSSMENAFSGASNLVMNATDTPDLSNVTILASMFRNASNLGNGTGNWDWDTSSITGMANIFRNAVSFDKDISSWNVENVINFSNMFTGATLSSPNYDALLISWDAQNVNPALSFNAGNSQYCSQAAQNARASIIANDGWTINDAGLAPACDGSLTTTHFVITFDTSIAGSTGSNSFNIPTTGSGYNYNIDSNNNGIFNIIGRTGDTQLNYGTPGIKTIRIAGDFPRIYFNESGDKDKILSVEQWGTNQWTSMNSAFSGASNLVINATDTPNLSNVTSLFSMFKNATSIGNGAGNWDWDTSNITGMANMFQNAVNFDKDISSWNIENVTNVGAMFAGATLSDANYDALLISWDAQNVNPALLFNAGNSQYCSQAAQDARASIIANDGWTITDAGLAPACVDEVIFADGFEDVIIVKSTNQQVNYNFSNVIIDELTQTPKLIIVGLDNTGAENMQIHIRNDLGVLQVRVSYLMGEQWQAQQWQDVDNNKTITLQW